MKCKVCDTEMFVDKTEQTDEKEIFYYKCPNPNCSNFGYTQNNGNK